MHVELNDVMGKASENIGIGDDSSIHVTICGRAIGSQTNYLKRQDGVT